MKITENEVEELTEDEKVKNKLKSEWAKLEKIVGRLDREIMAVAQHHRR